jgi:hypothetical protein
MGMRRLFRKRFIIPAACLIAALLLLPWFFPPRHFADNKPVLMAAKTLLAPQAHFGDGNATLLVEETLLGRLDENALEDGWRVSFEAKRFAYVSQRGEKQVVVADGVEGRAYDEIFCHVTGFDATSIWNPRPLYDYGLAFSDDGKRLAYVARRGEKWFVVVDGKEGPAHDAILNGEIVFSADGKRFAYFGIRNDRCFAVVDDKDESEFDIPELDENHRISRTPRGTKLAIPYRNCAVAFSPDGKRTAYSGPLNGEWVVELSGERWPAYDYSRSLTFSPDGDRLAYVVHRKSRRFVIVDSTQIGPYDNLQSVYFSADGALCIEVKVKGERWVVHEDGRREKRRSLDWNDAVSPDGKHVAEVIRTNPGTFGDAGRAINRTLGRDIFPASHQRKYRVVAGNVKERLFDYAHNIFFSKDSRHLAYMARIDDEWYAVVDGFVKQRLEWMERPNSTRMSTSSPGRFEIVMENFETDEFFLYEMRLVESADPVTTAP